MELAHPVQGWTYCEPTTFSVVCQVAEFTKHTLGFVVLKSMSSPQLTKTRQQSTEGKGEGDIGGKEKFSSTQKVGKFKRGSERSCAKGRGRGLEVQTLQLDMTAHEQKRQEDL